MITTEQLSGGSVTRITGPGYYATVAPGVDGILGLTNLEYLAGSKFFLTNPSETLFISNEATLAQTGRDASDATRELELFIVWLYAIGVNLTDTTTTFNLDAQLFNAGKLGISPLQSNPYRSINVFDFMVLTGAIEYPIAQLNLGERRPIVKEATQRNDKTVMFNVIRKLGIWGYCVDIFAEYGMTLEELAECLAEYLPDFAERKTYILSYVLPILRTKSFRILSDSELSTLYGE